MVSVMPRARRKPRRLFHDADVVLARLDAGLEGLQESIDELRQEVQILRSEDPHHEPSEEKRERTREC